MPTTLVSINFHLFKPCDARCDFCFATFRDVQGCLSLPDAKANQNHAGTLHAGALVTLAETAGSAACATHPDLASYQLMAKGFSVVYRTAAVGAVTARCEVKPELARTILWGVTTTGKAAAEIPIELTDSRGEVVAEFTAHYQFLRPRKG